MKCTNCEYFSLTYSAKDRFCCDARCGYNHAGGKGRLINWAYDTGDGTGKEQLENYYKARRDSGYKWCPYNTGELHK